jgi:hypothetical protein
MPSSETNWEKEPWRLKIERNEGYGTVRSARIIAAQPRTVIATAFRTSTDRAGRRSLTGILSQDTSHQEAKVCDLGITYAGLSGETLLANGDLIAAAPDMYRMLERIWNEETADFCLKEIGLLLARAREGACEKCGGNRDYMRDGVLQNKCHACAGKGKSDAER